MNYKIGWIALSAALVVLIPHAQAQPRYNITDLGGWPGDFDRKAWAINNSGQVVGYALDAAGPVRAFRTAPNSPINPATDDLGTFGFGQSEAFGINNSGQVTGWSLLPSYMANAFRTAPNSPINTATSNLGTLYPGAASTGYGINASGQVAGYGLTSLAYPPVYHVFRTAPNSPINPATDDLGTLGGTSSYSGGLNDLGQVVGSSYTSGDLAVHAFRTAPNAAINPATDDLGTFGGLSSLAVAINNSGYIAGCADTPGGFQHAFRLAPNRALNPATDDLGTLGGAHSCGYAINSSGQVVGSSLAPDSAGDFFPYRAMVYTGGVMYNLNNLIPAGSGWVLREARGINDLGQIVGYGSLNGQVRAFRLDPISGATPVGTNVVIQPSTTLPDGSTASVDIQFGSVSSGGATTVTASSTPAQGVAPAPPQFKVTSPPVYYNVQTTAVFNGTITLCFSWVEGQINNEADARLYHYEGGSWRDVTTGSPDTVNNKVCGTVTSLSPFGIFEPDFRFVGFQQPVSNPPKVNQAEAGSSIPVKFSLTGNFGVNIFKTGFPASAPIACDSLAPLAAAESTSAAGNGGLTYQAATDTYTYAWKTEKSWTGCRQLILRFTDGGIHTANFKFN